jgi:nucleoside-diphosphate-sugar epimerase
MILGGDGYIGWPLSMHLAVNKDETVVIVDKLLRRAWVKEVGSHSATPILSMEKRLEAFQKSFNKIIDYEYGDLQNYDFVYNIIKKYTPRAIVHLGEQPSAPYSMIDAKHATFTQVNNIVGTLNILHAICKIVPDCHLIKLGTMGEYGTPNIDIPEGFFEIEYNGRKDVLPFPKLANSFYHWSKVHDSGNIMFASKVWGLKSTDIMQGIVYGTRTNEIDENEKLLTRFDFDGVFGTVINRYCAQAVLGNTLTPYGRGGQKRGFIALRDSIRCLTLAIDNPPKDGEYRVFNQFSKIYSISELAKKVSKVANNWDLNTKIMNIENPRIETEDHYYNPQHEKLKGLGFKPSRDIGEEIEILIEDLIKYKDRLIAKKHVLMPKIRWKS